MKYAAEYMCLSETEGYTWGVIRNCMASVSDMAIVPMQDLLDLGAEGRMNFPGTMTDSNWTWRMKDGMMTKELAKRLLVLTTLYGRLAPKAKAEAKTEK